MSVVGRGLLLVVASVLAAALVTPSVGAARPLRGVYTQQNPSVALFVSKDRRHVLTFSGHTRRCATPPYVLERRALVTLAGSFSFRGSGRSFGQRWTVVVSGRFVSQKVVAGTFRLSSSTCSTGAVRFRATHQ